MRLPTLIKTLVLTAFLVFALGHAEDANDSLWQEEGLGYQFRLERLQESAAEYGFEPGTTRWQEANSEQLDDLAGLEPTGWPTPGNLLYAFIAQLGAAGALSTETWEITTRVFREGDQAIGAALLWGFKDDSVTGQDWRVTMEQQDGAWQPVQLETRYHCARGVSEDADLCL